MARSLAKTCRFLDSRCPPEVPSDPFFMLEAATIHVYSKEAACVGNRLLDFWREEGQLADAKVNAEKFSVKASVGVHQLCTVKVRLYRERRPGELAVEFQRRSGDTVLFNGIFQRARQYLQQWFSLSPTAPNAQLQEAEVVPANADFKVAATGPEEAKRTPVWEEAFCPLLDMAMSVDCPMLQAEAAAALASLAQDLAVAGALCSANAFQALVKLLQSDHLEVLHPATHVLRALATYPEGASCFKANLRSLSTSLLRAICRATRPFVRQELAGTLGAVIRVCAYRLFAP